MDSSEVKSNAQLIAAAPELLEALQLMVDMFETTDMKFTGRVPAEARRRFQIALNAIAKATTDE